jgi:hypothetical protein
MEAIPGISSDAVRATAAMLFSCGWEILVISQIEIVVDFQYL